MMSSMMRIVKYRYTHFAVVFPYRETIICVVEDAAVQTVIDRMRKIQITSSAICNYL